MACLFAQTFGIVEWCQVRKHCLCRGSGPDRSGPDRSAPDCSRVNCSRRPEPCFCVVSQSLCLVFSLVYRLLFFVPVYQFSWHCSFALVERWEKFVAAQWNERFVNQFVVSQFTFYGSKRCENHRRFHFFGRWCWFIEIIKVFFLLTVQRERNDHVNEFVKHYCW